MPWHPTVFKSQILSVHVTLIPVGAKGTVLTFGGDENNSAQGGNDATSAHTKPVGRTTTTRINGVSYPIKNGDGSNHCFGPSPLTTP